jgi:hypothetical protein
MASLPRIMNREMEGVAGSNRPRRRLFPGGRVEGPLPSGYLPVENAPLRRKVKRAVRSPQLHRPLFWLKSARQEALHVALHEAAYRAIVIESCLT